MGPLSGKATGRDSPSRRSEAGEKAIKRGGYAVEVQGLDQNPPIMDLAPLLRTEEAPQLLPRGTALLRGLTQKRLEGAQIALGLDQFRHPVRTQGTDQLILQVSHADKKPFPRRTGPLQPTGIEGELRLVTQPHEPQPKAGRPKKLNEPPHTHRTTHRQHTDPFGGQIPTAPRSQRTYRGGITGPFQQNNNPHAHPPGQLPRKLPGTTGSPRENHVPEHPHVSHATSLRPYGPSR